VTSRQPQTGRPLRRDAQRNRERIRAAASELFAQRGVAVTLDAVADHAGVGVGTVYRHYPNKHALLDELFEQHIAELADRAEGSLAAPDAWEALIGFLEHLLEGFAANRALEHLVLHPDRGRQRLDRARARLAEPVKALVERAKAEGRLRADFEASDIGMIQTMVAAVLDEGQASSSDLWRRYFAMIVDGLASERSAPTPLGVAAPPPAASQDVVAAVRRRTRTARTGA
jgi:AcrR family transcriptional regulator